MNNIKNNGSLILASASPRRKHLLEEAGLCFAVCVSRIDESLVPWSEPVAYTRELAEAKAKDVAGQYPDSWVIGADTIVIADGELLGKPVSREDARRMLNRLNNAVHLVYTGYAVVRRDEDHCHAEVVRTEVTFKDISPDEIEWYIHTPEPYDKAGGYAIQGLGSFLVREVRGSYTNVVGLPVCEVLDYLRHLGVVDRRAPDSPAASVAGGEVAN